METRLHGLGIGDGDMDTLLDNIRWDRTRMLPRPLERDDMRAILQELM
jgi:hypothetical protein